MKGVIRAELLRLRKRGALVLVVVAVPFLAVLFFGLGFASVYDPGPFDPARVRQDLIDSGYVAGLPPDEAERQLDEYVRNEETNHAMQLESAKRSRAAFAFPQSLVTILANATILLLGMALLSATTLGDEFGWGTIRTTLLGSSRRWRVLLVRLGALGATAGLIVALMLLAGAIAPLILGVASRPLPSPMPGIDSGALAVYVAGLLLASLAIIAFATLMTLVLRNGALTLVAILVYVVVEAAVLALLSRFDQFAFDFETGMPGTLAWTLDALPAHGLATLLDVGVRAATATIRYDGDVVPSVGAVALALIGFVAWGAVFAGVSFWRFRRMDIVE